MKDTRVQFVPARGNLHSTYGEPVDVASPDEWAAGRSYTLQARLPSNCVQGKFVIEDKDGLYSSMIPWSMASLKNPAYTMG